MNAFFAVKAKYTKNEESKGQDKSSKLEDTDSNKYAELKDCIKRYNLQGLNLKKIDELLKQPCRVRISKDENGDIKYMVMPLDEMDGKAGQDLNEGVSLNTAFDP